MKVVYNNCQYIHIEKTSVRFVISYAFAAAPIRWRASHFATVTSGASVNF